MSDTHEQVVAEVQKLKARIQQIQERIEDLILRVPTGKDREALTEANIHLMLAEKALVAFT